MWSCRKVPHCDFELEEEEEEEGARMASSIVSSATVAATNRATPVQSNTVAPFTGLKSSAAFPFTRKPSSDFSSLPSNGGRVQCMKVWPPTGLPKFETLSYLKDLSREEYLRQIAYLLRNGWIACIEFELEIGVIYRKYHASPGYYDGRYWTMWKLPMYGCTDPAQVLNEVDECAKEWPNSFVRIIGFDNVRQVQCISFIVVKPTTSSSSTSKTLDGGSNLKLWTSAQHWNMRNTSQFRY